MQFADAAPTGLASESQQELVELPIADQVSQADDASDATTVENVQLQMALNWSGRLTVTGELIKYRGTVFDKAITVRVKLANVVAVERLQQRDDCVRVTSAKGRQFLFSVTGNHIGGGPSLHELLSSACGARPTTTTLVSRVLDSNENLSILSAQQMPATQLPTVDEKVSGAGAITLDKDGTVVGIESRYTGTARDSFTGKSGVASLPRPQSSYTIPL